MKKIFLLLSCLILICCNGAKKDAAYECEDYLDKAIEAFDDGYYQVQQARRSTDWGSMQSYLQRAINYFNDAEKYSKKAADIASEYDYDVESYSKKAISSAQEACSHAERAFYSRDNYYVDEETTMSQRSSSAGQNSIKKAKEYLWY